MKRYLSVQKSVFQGKTRSTQETLPSKTCSWAKELKILRRLTTLLAARCRRRRHHWLFYWSLSKKILLIYFRCFLLSRCQRIPKKKVFEMKYLWPSCTDNETKWFFWKASGNKIFLFAVFDLFLFINLAILSAKSIGRNFLHTKVIHTHKWVFCLFFFVFFKHL